MKSTRGDSPPPSSAAADLLSSKPPSKKMKNKNETTVSVSASTLSASATATRVKEILHGNKNELPWVPGNFTHCDDVYAATYSLLNNVDDDEFVNLWNHLSGMAYLASPATIKSMEFQKLLLRDLLPAFMKLIVTLGFDLNKVPKNEIVKLMAASIKAFGQNDDTTIGCVYVKFICTTVADCMEACRALLRGENKRCGGYERMFVRRLLERLEEMKQPTANITLPYVGETSRQTFPARMKQMYPNVMYTLRDLLGHNSVLFEIKIGTVSKGNTAQARNLEAFAASLMCLSTNKTRAAAAAVRDETGCLGLMRDTSAFNNAICGERVGWRMKGGHEIHKWCKENVSEHRNEAVIEILNRSIPVLSFLVNEWRNIAEYVNTTDPSTSTSRAVCENTAASHKRERIGDITAQDLCRYFGHIVGINALKKGLGVFNPEYWKIRGDALMEEYYEKIKKEYKNKIENEPSGFYFPDFDSRMDHYFRTIRDANPDRELITGYRTGFWLEREENLDHLVVAELWKEAMEMKTYYRIHDTEERREHAELLSEKPTSFHIED